MHSQYASFIDELVKKRNFEGTTHEVRETLKKDAMERFDDFMLQRMIAAFSSEDADTFISLLKEQKSTKELSDFAQEHIQDYKAFMTSALTDFVKNYIGINT